MIVKFILEVMGAAGAVWGFTEILTLRNPQINNLIFRQICMAIFGLFLIRYAIVIDRYRIHLFCCRGKNCHLQGQQNQLADFEVTDADKGELPKLTTVNLQKLHQKIHILSQKVETLEKICCS